MKPASLLLLALLVMFAGAVQAADKTAERPNVLFIAIDDLNDWVGCMKGHPNAKTPNIDRLAERGVLFMNAHSQAPICGPSRASVFTGLLPSTSGIYGQIRDKDIPHANAIAGQATLLPRYFEKQGYETIAVGKLFHYGDAAKVFQKYGGLISHGPRPARRMHYDPRRFKGKMGRTRTDWGAFPDRDEQMPDYRIAAYGVEQLEQQHDKPFFLAVGFCRPHVPWHVPKKWFDMHPIKTIQTPPYKADDLLDVPELSRRVHELTAMPTTEWAIKANEWKNILQAYLACSTFVDAQVGKVLDALEASEYADNTIVVLWSDHGYHLGEKNRFAKQALWSRANRVPLIIAGPEVAVGKQSTAPVGLLDMYPTLVELCGLPRNALNDGHSLVPLLHEPDAAWDHFAITTYGRNNHALQSARFRFYQYEDGSQELYDHQDDPNEWHNLAGDAKRKPLIEQMQRGLPSTNAPAAPNIWYPTNKYFIEKAKQDDALRHKE